jgi:hypothetical protein
VLWLTEDAVDTFLTLTWTAAEHGQLPPHIVGQRLGLLEALTQPGSPQREALQHMYHADHPYPNRTYPAGERENPESADDEIVTTVDVVEATVYGEPDEPPSVSALTFTAERVGSPGTVARSGWRFHLSDPDPWPSVPHGHRPNGQQSLPSPKLDPWRNLILPTPKTATKPLRENPLAIVALWNDHDFQALARKAVEWHLADHKQRLFARIVA